MKIDIIKGDSGYGYSFNLKEPDGTITDLTAAESAKIRATHSDFPEVTFEKAVSIEDAVNGIVLYTLGADDFTKDGVYYSEIRVTFPGKEITYQGFSMIVLPRV
jgi:hypothetical protein